jgi:hypothetical protein
LTVHGRRCLLVLSAEKEGSGGVGAVVAIEEGIGDAEYVFIVSIEVVL